MRARFKDKVVLIFGAGSSGPGWGNGKAAAAVYAHEGALVVGVDLRLDAAQETEAALRQEGLSMTAMAADASASGQVADVVAQTLALHGRIDVLHNNVGITVMGDPVELSEQDWQRSLDINLSSAFLSCKHVLPGMLAQGSGAIVNISSLASLQINQYPYFAYQTAKAGLNHFTRALAVRYAARGIRANAVLPGVMDTPLIYQQIAGHFEDVEAMRKARHAASPMGRMGTAWDVANAAAFLASDEAAYITGVVLPVDGGKSCAAR
ncbi:SDR family NAD(P)-dependent oxidoreductase [Pseudacidovorax sp. RU35E]|uniref:SDR family NAD(P)-dependent oxidoreductase n=1 Tax=Pseudacidovorax sp. RU35E TaxID=1907403 RepID=UPI0009545FB6|nr:SDR family NAD(P)-dependent oxidoreductase [Pseudacidovorax sp. RU35E]SIR51862.1 NAD(P)-dependent dehydrogenase, short-chain alcohol dehydrogenase family [Pseudacidovorax sp. RU35E]